MSLATEGRSGYASFKGTLEDRDYNRPISSIWACTVIVMGYLGVNETDMKPQRGPHLIVMKRLKSLCVLLCCWMNIVSLWILKGTVIAGLDQLPGRQDLFPKIKSYSVHIQNRFFLNQILFVPWISLIFILKRQYRTVFKWFYKRFSGYYLIHELFTQKWYILSCVSHKRSVPHWDRHWLLLTWNCLFHVKKVDQSMQNDNFLYIQ